jgi:hypothetical protein
VTSFWLEWVPTLVAAVASLVGVVVTVRQLSVASRLRRRATFWSEQLEASSLAHDHEVLQSFHRETVARLVGLSAYSGRRMIAPALLILASTFNSGSFGYIVGTLAPSVTLDSIHKEGLDPLAWLAVVPLLALGLYRAASVIVRRRQVARRYLAGQDPTLTKLGNEGEFTAGLRQSHGTTWGMVLFSAGLCLLVAGISFLIGMPKGDPAALQPVAIWILGILFVGTALTLSCLKTVIKLFNQDALTWDHPRPLSAAAKQVRHHLRATDGDAEPKFSSDSHTGGATSWIGKLVQQWKASRPIG